MVLPIAAGNSQAVPRAYAGAYQQGSTRLTATFASPAALHRLVDSRWFAAADLTCAAISGFWWYSQPGIGVWPLLIALAPGAIRAAAGQFPIRRTAFDGLVIVFMLTAVIGVWAAYDREAATAKLWVLVGAAFLFYALAAQPQANLWLVAALLSGLSAVIAAYFLLSYDWLTFPRHFASLDRIGVWWMSVRPVFAGFLHPNVAGGLLAMLLPFQAAGWIRAWRQRNMPWLAAHTVLGSLTLIGLLLTSSRGAWGALAIATAAAGLWKLGGGLARRWHQPGWLISGALLLLALTIGAAAILTYPGGLAALAERVPDGSTRYELAYNTARLVTDFPFTGGGLAAFSGLYSRYMLVIVVPDYTYSHNFFLDVMLEQGVFGLLAWAGIMLGSLVLLARQPPADEDVHRLRWALAIALLCVGLHGLLDDALYGNQGTPLVLVLAGLSVAVTERRLPRAGPVRAGAHRRGDGETIGRRPGRLAGAVVGFSAGVLLLAVFGSGLAGAWYADLGAVAMARIELAGWPQAHWDQPIPTAAFGPAESLFAKALRFDPANRTANHRLGLMAERQNDYGLAVANLETAYQSDSGHRGLIKSLGDEYVWLGDLERAQGFLTRIPEAAEQMDTYAWWWRQQGQPERAAYAEAMAADLRSRANALAP